MDGKISGTWFRGQLLPLPACREEHEDKQMVLILDEAT